MSWAISCVGTKDGVKRVVTVELDSVIERYQNSVEGKDVVAIKDRILSLVNALDLCGGKYVAVVEASGSHSPNGNGGIYFANFSVKVSRNQLALD